MNVRQKFESMLVEMGMFPQQAIKVLDQAIPEMDDLVEDYKFTWERPADEYPSAIFILVFPKIKSEASKWITNNCPQAWFRGLFEEEKGEVILCEPKKFVRYPVEVTKVVLDSAKEQELPCGEYLELGKWIGVDVMEDGYSVPSLASGIDTQELCQQGCDTHNKYNGYSKDEANEIIGKSMEKSLSE